MNVRPPAVAGTFYPGMEAPLGRLVGQLLADARPPAALTAPPKALIVPHAGYIYSGPTAGFAYAVLRPWASRWQRVVLLGPTHRVPVRGLALPSAEAFATPLGEVAIDRPLADRLLQLPQVREDDSAHTWEHALEVQLPFLQTVLRTFTLLPLAVGDASPDDVAAVLEAAWGGEETLIVISSDLSHYHPYREAVRIDRATAEQVLDLRAPLQHTQACGATPINGLLLAARQHGLHAHLLDLRNSGDTAGERDRVVGYAAFAFTEEADDGMH